MSGVAIGMMKAITVAVQVLIHRDPLVARSVFCAAVVGAMPLHFAGLPNATTSAPAAATLTAVFGSCFPSK